MMEKKIVIICPYSFPSACGIWSRVYADTKLLSKNYKTTIFSSNIVKGTKIKSQNYEKLDSFEIFRFPVLFSFGGTSMFWFFIHKLIQINPDIIHVHGYRHPHSLMGLIIGKLMGKKVFLTTHGPFQKDPKRSIHLKLFDFFYDLIFSWWELKLYNKVIRVSEWEGWHLKKLGLKKSAYIPNYLDNEFLNQKVNLKQNNQILYMGRVDPVKRLEIFFDLAKEFPEINFKIWGPLNNYKNFESKLTNLTIIPHKYNAHDFIEELKKTDIYLLPSVRESFSISTLEAMALGVIPVVSDSALGPKDFIKNTENGFFFTDKEDLISKIKKIYSDWHQMEQIKHNAHTTANEYSMNRLGKLLLDVYNNDEKNI